MRGWGAKRPRLLYEFVSSTNALTLDEKKKSGSASSRLFEWLLSLSVRVKRVGNTPVSPPES